MLAPHTSTHTFYHNYFVWQSSREKIVSQFDKCWYMITCSGYGIATHVIIAIVIAHDGCCPVNTRRMHFESF